MHKAKDILIKIMKNDNPIYAGNFFNCKYNISQEHDKFNTLQLIHNDIMIYGYSYEKTQNIEIEEVGNGIIITIEN